MEMEFYCDLYVSDLLKKRKGKIIENLKNGKFNPFIYLITLAKGGQNHLEFYSSLLLRQHMNDKRRLFIVGLSYGYTDAMCMTRLIVNTVYKDTAGTDIKGYLRKRQREYEESKGKP